MGCGFWLFHFDDLEGVTVSLLLSFKHESLHCLHDSTILFFVNLFGSVCDEPLAWVILTPYSGQALIDICWRIKSLIDNQTDSECLCSVVKTSHSITPAGDQNVVVCLVELCIQVLEQAVIDKVLVNYSDVTQAFNCINSIIISVQEYSHPL